MSNIPKSFMDQVKKIYKKADYLDKYGYKPLYYKND